MTDGKPTPTVTSSGPIAQEIAKWLQNIRKGWTQSLDEPLSSGLRWLFAFAGSFTWLAGFILVLLARNPRLVDFISADVIPVAYVACAFTLLCIIVLSFGWLVAFTKRKCGPVRLFLDGLLLPAATVTIIALSVGRIQPAVDPRASSESSQDTRSQGPEESGQSQPTPLTRPQGSSQSSQDRSGAERSEEDSSEPPN